MAVEVHKQKLEIADNKIKLEALDRKISTEIEALNKMMKDLSGKFENLDTDNKKSMSTVNVLLQSKIDNDIIIRGFPRKPESELVCDNFIKYFNLDRSEVLSHYYFPYTSKFSGKTSHNVIISFREKQTKMNILSRKKQLGPLLLNRLVPDQSSSTNIATVTYTNRLSKFNLHAIYHLNKAKNAGKVFSIRFHNLCFAVKETERCQWTRISNTEELQKYKIEFN